MTTTRALARNTVLNVMGALVPMLAAVLAIPVLLQRLGAPRFGVLTLAWAAIGYFSLFDVGLGRALTQAIAERLGRDCDEDELADIAWTALSLMLLLALIGSVLLFELAPWIVHRVLTVPGPLAAESVSAFYLLALSLPFVVTTAGLRGLLEAHQDFGAATALRLPLAVFTFLGPLAVIPYSVALGPIVAMLVLVRGVTWLAHLIVCVRRYSYLRRGLRVRRHVVLPLMRYGGWMTTSNIVSPLMAYMDRFFIGAILPLAAVAHYVTPFEIVTRLLVLPTAVIGVMFPAFAATYVANRERTGVLFERALRALLLLMFPMMLVIVLFAREGLTLWVGPTFAAEGASVLRWLAVGVFINGLAQAPFSMLQGTGRPDLTAKLHLIEAPLYFGGLWWLAHRFGIVGVAMAWTFRVAVDALALLVMAQRRIPDSARQTDRTVLAAAAAVAVLSFAAVPQHPVEKAAFVVLAGLGFAVLGWTQVVQPEERRTLRHLMGFSPDRVPPAR